jgi:hypothetical protein
VRLLRRFFDVCYTKTRAYHTRIPVLVLRQPTEQEEGVCCEQCAERLAAESVKEAAVLAN